MERFFLTSLNWPETILQGLAAVLLIWADIKLNYLGLILFIPLVLYQIFKKKKTAVSQAASAAEIERL